jgi:putative membrane protein
MDSTRLLFLTIHVVGFVGWVGMLLAVAAILVQRDGVTEPALRTRIGALARKTALGADIGATLALLGGLGVLFGATSYYLHQPWMHMKLTAVLAVIGVHGFVRAKAKRASLTSEATFHAAILYVLALVAIVIIALAIFKPLARG